MQLLNALPRQPFIGLALGASTGILVADFHPNDSLVPLTVLAILALAALLSRSSAATYVVVAAGFFFLHSLRTSDSPALQLAREFQDRPWPITVAGQVVSEPRISSRGVASFLLETQSIEVDGDTRRCHVRFL